MCVCVCVCVCVCSKLPYEKVAWPITPSDSDYDAVDDNNSNKISNNDNNKPVFKQCHLSVKISLKGLAYLQLLCTWPHVLLFRTLSIDCQLWHGQHVALAEELGALLLQDGRFEMPVPPTLGLVCFRLKVRTLRCIISTYLPQWDWSASDWRYVHYDVFYPIIFHSGTGLLQTEGTYTTMYFIQLSSTMGMVCFRLKVRTLSNTHNNAPALP